MFSSKKPYSSVTVTIERLTSEQYEEDDLGGIPDLVEAIKLQSTGPTEAARALRKKLKYGNVHRQLRALSILDGLIENAGARFQRAFVDEPLLERLRVCGTSDLSDQQVKNKCKLLFGRWSREYSKTAGLERIAGLYKELPRRKQQVTQEKSKVLRETERDPFEDAADEEEEGGEPHQSSSKPPPKPSSPPRRTSLSFAEPVPSKVITLPGSKRFKKEKKGSKKPKPFDLEQEKAKMKTVIAESSVASINLLNALQFINREHEQVSENAAAAKQFDTCKLLRRHVLRYIQHVESEQWLGALIHANDELVTALMTFEQLDRSIDADSDSEDEAAEQAHLYRLATEKGKGSIGDASYDLARLHLDDKSGSNRPRAPSRPIPPSRPPAKPSNDSEDEDSAEEEDENDPFGDRNAVQTPHIERGEPKW